MGFYSDRILSRLIHWVLGGRDIAELRRKYLADVEGTVLEIGEGAGFRLERIERFYIQGPKIGTYLYAGKAV